MAKKVTLSEVVHQACLDAIGKGWTQRDLAIAAGIQPASLSRWLRKERVIDIKTLESLAAFFQISIGRPTISRPTVVA